MESMHTQEARDEGVGRSVKIWLFIGLLMIFVQVIVGGVTRLTGSGLSITKWEIITGTVPPMNQAAWDVEFDLYKATPQYKEINQGMTLSEFKFIYFWEYIHRFWARSMGFVFLIPFLYFSWKKMLPATLMKDLGIVVFLAAVVASFGWIMVASGLIDRPWVSAYKLTMHLSLAFILYAYLLWATFKVSFKDINITNNSMLRNWSFAIIAVLAIQIVLGGLMSGMKAAVFYPTWPDMGGVMAPKLVFNISNWNVNNFMNYDTNLFVPALIQLLHRSVAYLLTIIIIYFSIRAIRTKKGRLFHSSVIMLVSMLVVQALLGILTLLYSQGSIPVALGVFHQGGALLLLSIALFIRFQLRKSPV